MSAPMTIMVALVGILFLVVVALSYRLWKLGQGGTPAILRDTPAVGGHGWRHGVIRYRGGEARFYRLSSLRLWPDRRLGRRGLEIVSRRAPRGDEFDIMTEEIVVPSSRTPAGRRIAAMNWLWIGCADGVSFLARIPAISAGAPAQSLTCSASGIGAAGPPQDVAVRIGYPAQDE